MTSIPQSDTETTADPLAANSKLPWDSDRVPDGWQLTLAGLYREYGKGDDKQVELISGSIWISAIAYGNQKDNWTAVIEFLDIDGHRHKLTCGRDRFHEKGNSLVSELAGLGLYIVPSKETKLLQYLVVCNPDIRLRSVDKLGWLDSDNLIYVRQHDTIGTLTETDKPVSVIYKPERHVSIGQSESGNLEDWQTNVVNTASGEDIFLFTLCLAFAPPLLKPALMDSFGLNLSGGTTKGKTTALQIATSVWGNGADPAAAPELSYAKRWNNTANGLEGLAGEHTDGLMALDELGTCAVKEFDYVVYNLLGGLGKGAMTADRQLKKQRRWRLIVLSTGEITVQEKLEQSGKKAKGGQLVRFPDVPFQLSSKITAAHIDTLKRDCSRYYGTAGTKYIEYLASSYVDFNAFSKDIRDKLDIATDVLKQAAGKNLTIEQVRCAKRFALVLIGGGLARTAGILRCESQRIQDAVVTTFQAYLKDSPGINDGERGILAVRDFILCHQAGRLIKIGGDNKIIDKTVNNLAGYIVLDGETPELFLLFQNAFQEACSELGKKAVAAALAENNLLRLDKPDRYVCRYLIGGQEKQQTFYAIKKEILSFDG